MLSSRLAGVVQQAVAAAVYDSRDVAGGRAPAPEVAAVAEPRGTAPAHPAAVEPAPAASNPASPAGLASSLLRCLEAQLQTRKYMNAGDEAGDVLGTFPSSTLFHYPGGGLQAVLEQASGAAAEARGPVGAATVSALLSLANAVGRVAAQPNAEAARGKAAGVMTCLLGMAEALEGATRSTSGVRAALEAPAEAEADAEAAALLNEASTVLDCIAGGSAALPSSRTGEGGRTVSPSAPAHPLLAAMETRLYSEATWYSLSAAEIAGGLVDYLASLLAPGRAGTTAATGTAAARGHVCGALHGMAQAQMALAAKLRDHGADPAAASRQARLGQALAAAVITRDASESSGRRGPRPEDVFGEAQLLLGLSRMAAGEALSQAQTAGLDAAISASMSIDAAAGDSSLDMELAVTNASLVLEVLAADAARVAAGHRQSIRQVLQDLRSVPQGLERLLGLTASPVPQPATATTTTAATTPAAPVLSAADLLRSVVEGHAASAAADAAASVAASVAQSTTPQAPSGTRTGTARAEGAQGAETGPATGP
ncbi:hypothetical protein GPECTOR_34g787 [Gonium pectorale]|uniref:Uncharacterized protein n=1 Tax=Gonium pectorale TaxID=33097 RepID=A0A150GCS9_GONPE|nr:hypothetical protein GPECTOR_34g787 [Gonium pectorale]|eukprot:KXZ47628.1 hypothetical protein GPECTOR_34g787 [Gonium pectorale]